MANLQLPTINHQPSRPVRSWLNCPWQVRWLLLLAYAGLLAWLSLAPAETFIHFPASLWQHTRLLHFLMYGGLVSLARWAMAAHWNVRPAFVVVVFGAIAYGSLMEILQGALVRYHRTFEFSDILANSLGALCFWWLSRLLFVPPTSLAHPASASEAIK